MVKRIKKSDKTKKKIPPKNVQKKKKTVVYKWSVKTKIFATIFLALCVATLIGIILLVRHLVIMSKYSYYTDKMEWYGYNLLYDNESAKSTEHVETEEIVKMVVGVLYNETDREFANRKWYRTEEKELSTNETWMGFATSIPLASVNDIGINSSASKLQVATLIIEGIEVVYGKEIEITEPLKEKYRKDYTEYELEVIDKAISIGILENKKQDINKKDLLKGELNKMLIIASEKYSMVYYNNVYSKNDKANIVLDEEKMPTNADIYPYVIDSISNDIYEIEMPEMLSEISVTPKQVYDIYHDVYYSTDKIIREYFDAILNVDYKNITAESFKEQISSCVVYNLDTTISESQPYLDAIEEYVNYVKNNKIVLKGGATPLLPIIYSNGMIHYVRCKIDLEVVSSDTNKNLLFWDDSTTYNGDTISVYVDIAVSPTIYSKVFRIYNGTSVMKNVVLDTANSVIVE